MHACFRKHSASKCQYEFLGIEYVCFSKCFQEMRAWKNNMFLNVHEINRGCISCSFHRIITFLLLLPVLLFVCVYHMILKYFISKLFLLLFYFILYVMFHLAIF